MTADSPALRQRPDMRLFWIGTALLAAILVYYGLRANTTSSAHTQLGLIMIFLAVLPLLLWARQLRIRYPIFEIFLLTTGNVYAVPLLNGHELVLGFSEQVITSAAVSIILYQLAAIITYQLTQGRPRTTPFWSVDILSERIGTYLSYGMVVNSAYTIASTFFDIIPGEFNGILRAVCFGIGTICTFVTARLWGAGQLKSDRKVFFVVNFTIQFLVQMTTLYLVGSISLLLLALLGYVSGSRRIPVILTACLLVLIALLHNGKSAMREKYWSGMRNPIPQLAEVPGFFSEWIGHGLQPSDQSGEANDAGSMTERLLQRTSLFHLMCLVVSASPAQLPFLDGETYKDIPAQLVPRPLWPGKPNALAGTYRLAIYYGLQSEEEVQKTTIGFGMHTEAYANFGYYGLVMLGAVFGFAFKKIQLWSCESPIFSYPGVFLILLMAWSFQTEFTLSVWLSSMFQASVAVVGVPFVVRKITS